jgi:hypothetical protein
MDLDAATRRLDLGESMSSIAAAVREAMLASVGMTLDEASPQTFAEESRRFMSKLCRHVERVRAGNPRIGAALRDWVQRVDDFDAFDVLLTSFPCEQREAVLRRGRVLFPRTLTAHW